MNEMKFGQTKLCKHNFVNQHLCPHCKIDQLTAENESLKFNYQQLGESAKKDAIRADNALREVVKLREAIALLTEAWHRKKLPNSWFRDEPITWGAKIRNLLEEVE